MDETPVFEASSQLPPALSTWAAETDWLFYFIFWVSVVFFVGIWEAFSKKRVAGDNPWGVGADTLEWQLSSPPPYHQWEQLPRIK